MFIHMVTAWFFCFTKSIQKDVCQEGYKANYVPLCFEIHKCNVKICRSYIFWLVIEFFTVGGFYNPVLELLSYIKMILFYFCDWLVV